MARGKSTTIESVKTGLVASASSAQHTTNVLRLMLREKYAAGTFKVLTVPKDIDALMSVGFGSSKSALTTSNCLEELKILHPVLHKKMNVLAEGEESLLLILAVPERFKGRSEKMITIINGMAKDPDGKRKIRMLGLDGWQTLAPSERSELEG